VPKAVSGGWRAFSLGKQVDIATSKPVTSAFNFEGDPLESEGETFFINDKEITGELLPTQSRLLNRKFSGKHKSKAFPHVVGLFASMCMGKDTPTLVGATTAYNHKIEIDKTMVELPYRTMVENDGLAQFLYAGVGCAGFTLSGKRGEFVEIEADLIGRASEAADATVKPARLAESYLAYGDCNFTKGGVYSGTAVAGGTSFSAALQSFKLEVKNNAKATYLVGDSTGQVGRILRGPNFSVTFEADLDLEDQSHRADLLAGNEFVLDLPIVGGIANGTAKYTVEVVLPRIVYKEAKKGVADGMLKLAAKFETLVDPTYGGIIINVINMQTASYLS
jgi:hypothetical protein